MLNLDLQPLNLDLQPLSLNPLGLTVTLQEFKLVIVAVRGPGTCWATWCAPSPVCSTPEGSSAACCPRRPHNAHTG